VPAVRGNAAPGRTRFGALALGLLCVCGLLSAPALARVREAASGGAGLGGLTRLQLAGQRVIFSYPGLTPPASLLARIKAGEAAGVIFFSDNIASDHQIAGVVDELEQAARHSPVKAPLLLMTDQEGGLVRRLPGGPTLSEKQIGASSQPGSTATAAGRTAGQNLAGVGMNVNLAPVLDVFRTPGNFIDEFGRSYSSDPHVVSTLGADFIKAQQHTGVAATAKHFPGLGAAGRGANTDEQPVTLGVSLHGLRTVDELPYTAAIKAGVRLVMVSWAVYPALDRHRPAGLSSAVVKKELRGRLHFHGVTITDALGAGALRAFGSSSNRAVLAAGSGMDLILCASQSVAEGISAEKALAAKLKSGYLGSVNFSAAVDRVESLRQSF
jgi:beta-N-acetylhexosaminidase